ncbi:MAG: MBL fold metallo-hydrolase [Chlorobi bacterium]|nr:MBL fold metallo-hydrolase [Chlorobiota bacterium]
MNTDTTRFFPIETCRFRLDGGAMFGVVPKNLWNRTNPADEQNRIDMAARLLLIKRNEQTILIDTGLGYKLSDKMQKIYDVDFSRFTLEHSLAEVGESLDSITDVIITHLHFDHVGGAVSKDHDRYVPTFPRARYHVQKQQWQWALHPSERDRASYFPENYLPLQEHGVLNLLEGETDLFPGIHVIPVEGHTFGQQVVLVETERRKVLYAADLIPIVSHIPAPYIMGYDLQPLVTLREKNELLSRAVEERWVIFFEHDPVYEAATVVRTEKGFRPGRMGALSEILSGDQGA